MRRVHAGDPVPPQELDKFLLAHRLHLAGLDGFGSDFMGNVGQNRAETHHVAGAGDLEDHGLAVARSGGDLYLAEADDEDVAGRVAFVEELGAPGMAHHDSNRVEILQSFRCEIAEHPEMAVLAVETIFRRVMRVERSHTCRVNLWIQV